MNWFNRQKPKAWKPHPNVMSEEDYATFSCIRATALHPTTGTLKPHVAKHDPTHHIGIIWGELLDELPLEMTLDEYRSVLLENLNYHRSNRNSELLWIELEENRDDPRGLIQQLTDRTPRLLTPEHWAKEWERQNENVHILEFMLGGFDAAKPVLKPLPSFLLL